MLLLILKVLIGFLVDVDFDLIVVIVFVCLINITKDTNFIFVRQLTHNLFFNLNSF